MQLVQLDHQDKEVSQVYLVMQVNQVVVLREEKLALLVQLDQLDLMDGLDHRGHLEKQGREVPLVHKDLLELKENVVQRGLLGLQDLLVLEVQMEKEVSLVILGIVETLVLQVLRVQGVKMVCKDQLVHKDPKELQEVKDHQDQLDLLDLLVHEEHREPLGRQVNAVLLESKVNKVKVVVQELLV